MSFNRRQVKPRVLEETKNTSLFQIKPILINIIAITVLILAYYFILQNDSLYDYADYFYWVINVIISYNILVASARTFIAPILTILIALGFLFASMFYNINLVTTAQFWQLISLGTLGFLITIFLKL